MSALTFITPVAPEHVVKLDRAIDSVNAQTVPCQHLHAVDYDRIGAGAMRNRLLAQVTTPYVSFLDADDWLEPDFAERTLSAMQAGRYVYTDWYEGDKVREAPNKAWCGGTWHVITAVVATADAQHVGGFDETLAGLEDTDFYLKFTTRHICGIRVKKPLMHYAPNGGRSLTVKNNGQMAIIQDQLLKRYGAIMGCCGQNTIIGKEPVNTERDGDIQAMALWRGNRVQRSSVDETRFYPRGSYPRIYWIHPRDATLNPNLWQPVQMPEEKFIESDIIHQPLQSPETLDSMAQLANQMLGDGVIKPAPLLPPKPAKHTDIQPDYSAVATLAYTEAG